MTEDGYEIRMDVLDSLKALAKVFEEKSEADARLIEEIKRILDNGTLPDEIVEPLSEHVKTLEGRKPLGDALLGMANHLLQLMDLLPPEERP